MIDRKGWLCDNFARNSHWHCPQQNRDRVDFRGQLSLPPWFWQNVRGMSVAILIPESWSPAVLVQWARCFAQARRQNLVVLRVLRRPGEPRVTHHQHLHDVGDPALSDALRELRSSDPFPHPGEGASSMPESMSRPETRTVTCKTIRPNGSCVKSSHWRIHISNEMPASSWNGGG